MSIDPTVDTGVDTPAEILANVEDSFKAGWRTSEFWVTILGGGFAAVLITYDHSQPFTKQVVPLGILLATSVYVSMRTWLKTRRLKAQTAQTAITADVGTETAAVPAIEAPPESADAPDAPRAEDLA